MRTRFSFLTSATSFLFFLDVFFTQAFPIHPNHGSSKMISLNMQSGSMHDGDSSGDFFDVEAARRQLESLVGGTELQQQQQQQPQHQAAMQVAFPSSLLDDSMPSIPSLDTEMPPPPPLTTIERERRRKEIQLMSQLIDGDETVDGVTSLWFAERGPVAEAALRKAEALISEGPGGWREAEEILLALIDEYGVYFAEPLHCLATLYYVQSRPEESLRLCQMVLTSKPWHFGALSCIVLAYAAVDEADLARQWAARRLPKFQPEGANRRRNRWVERAVLDAYSSLNDAERRLTESFGASDKHPMENQKKSNVYENDVNAWQ